MTTRKKACKPKRGRNHDHDSVEDDRRDDAYTKLSRKLSTIIQTQEAIMTAISDFAAKMKVFTDRQDVAVTNLIADVKTLNDKITELQNSGGGMSAEDKTLLDEIHTHAGAIADKLDALDATTPPAVPAA